MEPHLGELPIEEVTTRDLNRLYARLFAGGGAGGRPLSMRTVEYVHGILHKAWAEGVALGTLTTNPATGATLPRIDHVDAGDPDHERTVWTPEQLRVFLEGTHDHRLGPLWAVAAFTGMRRGELLGLRWADVDLEGGVLRVRRSLTIVRGHARLKETKTGRSRTLHLDPFTVHVLRRQRSRQAAWQRERGPCWENRWDLVFTGESGRHLSPDAVSNSFRHTVNQLPVPRKRLHDLRHFHATAMLQAGVPVKVVSERLGHASAQLTMDIYAHVLPAMDAEAVERFAEHVLGDVNGGIRGLGD